jgi:hypothetical protein
MRGPAPALLLAQAEGPTLASALVALAGAAVGALGTYLARRYRARSEAALAERRQLFDQYRRLVAELRGQVARLAREVRQAERHYLECRLENAALRARAAELEQQVRQLTRGTGHGAGDDAGPAGGARPDGGGAP